jgi:hypothetical protein
VKAELPRFVAKCQEDCFFHARNLY